MVGRCVLLVFEYFRYLRNSNREYYGYAYAPNLHDAHSLSAL